MDVLLYVLGAGAWYTLAVCCGRFLLVVDLFWCLVFDVFDVVCLLAIAVGFVVGLVMVPAFLCGMVLCSFLWGERFWLILFVYVLVVWVDLAVTLTGGINLVVVVCYNVSVGCWWFGGIC